MSEADNTNLVKKLVKINYRYNHFVPVEWFLISFTIVMALIALLFVCLIITSGFSTAKLLVVFVFIFLSCIPFAAIIPLSQERRDKRRRVRATMAHGERTIGEVISLKHAEISGRDSVANRDFIYTVKLKDPGHAGQTLTIETPAVVGNKNLINEKDLPIKALVYYFDNLIYVDSLINPPQ